MAAPRFKLPGGNPAMRPPWYDRIVRGSSSPKPPAKPPRKPGLSILDQVNRDLDALYGPARAEIERARTEETTRTAARTALVRALYAQLAGIQGNVAPQVAGLFSNAAANTAGLASGYSEGMQAKLDANAMEANALQGLIGAPAGQQVQGGEAASNVLYGTSGAIPAATLETQGAAFGSAAAYLPGATFGRGMADIQSLLQDSEERLKDLDQEGRDLGIKQDSDRVKLLEERRELKKQEAQQLYDLGFLTQRELAKRLGVRNWRKFPNKLKGEEGAKPSLEWSRELGYIVDEDLQPIRDRKGNVIPLAKDEKPNLHFWQDAYGADWMLDVSTGKVVQLSGGKSPAPIIRGGPGQGFTIFDQAGNVITTIPGTAPSGVQVTPKMRAQARRWAKEAFYGKASTEANPQFGIVAGAPKTLTVRGVRLSYPDALDYLVSKGIPPMLAWQSLKRYYPKAPRPKGEAARSGRRNTASGGPSSLDQSLWSSQAYALSQGFTDLGTHNPASRLPGGGMSDHAVYPARAFDLGFSGGGGWNNRKAREMFWYMTRQPSTKYVILGDKIWSRSRGLHAYTSGGHDTHIHVSGNSGGSA